jgi:hypothetical protein
MARRAIAADAKGRGGAGRTAIAMSTVAGALPISGAEASATLTQQGEDMGAVGAWPERLVG